jgi:hypothetical protein
VGPARAWAQSSTVEGGVKVGIVAATLSVDGLPGLEPNAGVGAQAGGWVSTGRDAIRVQAEVNVGVRRFTLTSAAGDIEVSSRIVELPVLVVGRWRPDARVRPLLLGGVSIGFVSNVTQTFGSTETDIDDQIEDVDAALVIGGGLQVAAGSKAIVVDARYAFGLRDLSESGDTVFKSRTFVASFGYRF